MKISYRYINREGKKKTAVIEASDLNEARKRLASNGIYVISMKMRMGFRKAQSRLKPDQLILFTSQLSHLLNAAIPLYESLLSLQEQYAHESFFPILVSIANDIKEGSSLAEALEKSKGGFSRLYLSMIVAGESAGTLAITLDKLTKLLQKQNRLKKQLLTTLLYPLILLGFSSILITILFTFVVPSLESLFLDIKVNRFTRFVFFCSHIVTKGWPIYLPLLGGATGFFIYFFKKTQGKRLAHLWSLKTPIVKDVVVQAALARFCRTMGTLLEGGVSIISALQISRGVMRQPQLEEAIAEAEKKIVEGSFLSTQLRHSQWVPPLVPRMLAIGEEGGNLAVMLGRIADLYEEEVEKLLTRIAALTQPVILIFLGSIVGLIMLAILLPLTDVSGFMGGY